MPTANVQNLAAQVEVSNSSGSNSAKPR